MKFPKYEVYGEELSTEVSYLQAATILDIIAIHGVKTENMELLGAAATMWMELGERLMVDGPEEPQNHQQQNQNIGFNRTGENSERVS